MVLIVVKIGSTEVYSLFLTVRITDARFCFHVYIIIACELKHNKEHALMFKI